MGYTPAAQQPGAAPSRGSAGRPSSTLGAGRGPQPRSGRGPGSGAGAAGRPARRGGPLTSPGTVSGEVAVPQPRLGSGRGAFPLPLPFGPSRVPPTVPSACATLYRPIRVAAAPPGGRASGGGLGGGGVGIKTAAPPVVPSLLPSRRRLSAVKTRSLLGTCPARAPRARAQGQVSTPRPWDRDPLPGGVWSGPGTRTAAWSRIPPVSKSCPIGQDWSAEDLGPKGTQCGPS